MRVQCSLDASHHTDRLEAQFLDQEFLFPEAYAMFALDSSISHGRSEQKVIDGESTVQVPSISKARSTISCTHFSTAARSDGLVLSYKMLSWKLPSPT